MRFVPKLAARKVTRSVTDTTRIVSKRVRQGVVHHLVDEHSQQFV